MFACVAGERGPGGEHSLVLSDNMFSEHSRTLSLAQVTTRSVSGCENINNTSTRLLMLIIS